MSLSTDIKILVDKNETEELISIIENTKYNKKNKFSEIFDYAIKKDNVTVVDSLYNLNRINNYRYTYRFYLNDSIRNKSKNVFIYFMNKFKDKGEHLVDYPDLLRTACSYGKEFYIEYLLEQYSYTNEDIADVIKQIIDYDYKDYDFLNVLRKHNVNFNSASYSPVVKFANSKSKNEVIHFFSQFKDVVNNSKQIYFYRSAIKYVDYSYFKKLLNLGIPSCKEVIQLLIHENKLKMFKTYIKQYNIKINEDFNNLFIEACENNSTDIVRYLLKFKDINFLYDNQKSLVKAFYKRHFDIVEILIKSKKFNFFDNTPLLLNALFHKKEFEDSYRYHSYYSMRDKESEHSKIDTILLFLIKNKNINFKEYSSYLLQYCIEREHYSSLKILLKVLEVEDNNIILSLRVGNSYILRLLLKHFNNKDITDILDNSSELYKNVTSNKNLNCIKVLNNYKNFNKSKFYIEILKESAIKNYDEIFSYIFKKSKLPKNLEDNALIKIAAEHESFYILNYLLKYKEVSPECPSIIKTCIKKNQYSLVKKLLKYKEVNPFIGEQKLFNYACKQGYNDIVKLLLKDKRIIPELNDNAALEEACSANKESTVLLLLKNKRITVTNQALANISQNYNRYLIDKFLKYQHLDLSTHDNFLIKKVVEKNDTKFFFNLINKYNVHFNKEDSPDLFGDSIDNNNIDIFNHLISSSSLDPFYEHYEIFYKFNRESSELIKNLISNLKFDFSKRRNLLIKTCFKYEFKELVDILWKDNKVQETLEEDYHSLYYKLAKENLKRNINNF